MTVRVLELYLVGNPLLIILRVVLSHEAEECECIVVLIKFKTILLNYLGRSIVLLCFEYLGVIDHFTVRPTLGLRLNIEWNSLRCFNIFIFFIHLLVLFILPEVSKLLEGKFIVLKDQISGLDEDNAH